MGKLEKGITTAVNALGKASDGVGSLVSSKKEFITKNIINGILLIVILLAFGCFDFLHLEFHFEYLADPNYWVDVLIKAVADICAYNIGINFIIDDVIKRNEQIVILKRHYEKLNSCKQADFEEFIPIYNKEQKVLAYKHKMTRLIYLLNKVAKRKDKILYNKWLKDNTIDIHKNRYCIKRKELEYLRSDEYIKENIDALDVKYVDVDSSVFEMEIDGSPKVVQNKVVGSVSKGRAVASSSTLLGVVIFSMVFRSIGLSPNKQEFENQMVAAAYYAISIASDIGIIVWQFMRGILGTHRIVSQQVTTPLAERVKILKKYYEWRIAKGYQAPRCYLEILEEEKEEKSSSTTDDYVEMTPKEYEEWRKKREQAE